MNWWIRKKIGFEDKTDRLQLLVEKDFTCLDNVEEDQSDITRIRWHYKKIKLYSYGNK